MVKVYCDMCLREIDYEKDGVNLDFNRFGTVRFKQGQDLEKQLCKSCALFSNNGGTCGNDALYLKRPPQSWCYVEEAET